MQKKAQSPLEEEAKGQKDKALLIRTRRIGRLSSQYTPYEMSFLIKNWLQKEDHI